MSRRSSASIISNSSSSSFIFRGMKIGPSATTCAGCGTIILNNGLMDCVLPLESTIPLQTVPKSGCGGSSSSTIVQRFLPPCSPLFFEPRASLACTLACALHWSWQYQTLCFTLPHMMRYLCGYDGSTNIPTITVLRLEAAEVAGEDTMEVVLGTRCRQEDCQQTNNSQ
jgi:hypothetical protein